MCGANCGLTALTKQVEGGPQQGRHVYLLPNEAHPQRGYCGRGASSLYVWNHPLRLKTPLKRMGARGEGKFEPVGWDQALDEMNLVHAGPVQAFHRAALAEAGLP